MEERTQGILLQSHPVGEADLLVQFFTPDRGRITLKAQGAKRSKKRFSGLLESFSHHHMAFEAKPSGRAVLLWLDPIEMHIRLRHNLGAFAAASHAVELVSKLTQEHDPNPQLFALLVSFLRYCTDHAITPKVLARFLLRLLHDMGLQPDWKFCMECGRPFSAERTFRFDLAQGGVICSSCIPSSASHLLSLPLRLPLQQLLSLLQQKQTIPDVSLALWSDALSLLNQRINHLLGFPPRSRDFLYEMNPELPPASHR